MTPLQLAFESTNPPPQKTCANEILSYPADLGCAYGTVKCLCEPEPHEKMRRALVGCMDGYCNENRDRQAEVNEWLLKLGCQA
jgi:hypothetical protein